MWFGNHNNTTHTGCTNVRGLYYNAEMRRGIMRQIATATLKFIYGSVANVITFKKYRRNTPEKYCISKGNTVVPA